MSPREAIASRDRQTTNNVARRQHGSGTTWYIGLINRLKGAGVAIRHVLPRRAQCLEIGLAVLDEGFMEQILRMTLRHNPMIRLDISQLHPKEGDRGKPLALEVPMQEAVVNQRLHSSSEVMWKLFLQIRSSSGAL